MQAKQFSVATTKIRIGRRPRCRYDRCRRAIPHCSSDDAASIPKSGLEIKNHCSPGVKSRENRALILKFGPEIKNRCTQEGLNREILASIPKSGPEIKNRCTQEGLNRENPASIPKSGPEIKNRCMQQAIFSMRSLDEPLWRYAGGNMCGRWFDSGGESGC